PVAARAGLPVPVSGGPRSARQAGLVARRSPYRARPPGRGEAHVTVAEGPRRTAGVPAPTPPKSLREFVDKSGLRSLVIGVSKDPNAKLTILLVQPGSGRPTLVVKAATTDHAARAIEAQVDIPDRLP